MISEEWWVQVRPEDTFVLVHETCHWESNPQNSRMIEDLLRWMLNHVCAVTHGPDEPCTCDGCWACKGRQAGCTCDVDWDAVRGHD